MIGREVDDGEQGANQQPQTVNALDAFADDAHDFHETPGRFAVARAAEVAHDRPGSRGVVAGLGGGDGVDAGELGGDGVQHRGVADQEEAGGDGEQPQLVSVSHHRRHAGQAEVERGNRIAQLAQEGQREAAEGGVDVQVQALALRQVGKLLDRVDLAEVSFRRGTDQRHGVGVEQPLDLPHVGAHGVVHVDFAQAQAQQLGAQPEAVVGRGWQHDFGFRLGSQVAGQAQGQQVRLGAAAGDEADGVTVSQQRAEHAHGFLLQEVRAGIHVARPLHEKGSGGQRAYLFGDGVGRADVADAEVAFDGVGVHA